MTASTHLAALPDSWLYISSLITLTTHLLPCYWISTWSGLSIPLVRKPGHAGGESSPERTRGLLSSLIKEMEVFTIFSCNVVCGQGLPVLVCAAEHGFATQQSLIWGKALCLCPVPLSIGGCHIGHCSSQQAAFFPQEYLRKSKSMHNFQVTLSKTF